jgi:hypothetical protein
MRSAEPQVAPAPVPVDPESFASARGRAAERFGRDPATRAQQGEALLYANGQWPLKEGHLYLVQIDQDGPPPPTPVPPGLTGEARLEAKRRFDAEKLAIEQRYLHRYTGETVLFKAMNGRLVEQNPRGVFRSAAHPGQLATTTKNLDVNGDGLADIATLRAGAYEYLCWVNEKGYLPPASGQVMKAARDRNHDGAISPEESAYDDYAGGADIHAGDYDKPRGIGCPNLTPDDYKILLQLLRQSRQRTFTFLLVRRPNDETGANPL